MSDVKLTPDTHLDWKFVQSFGDDNSSDDDLVTAVDFDDTGNYLAVGDKAGRICVFEGQDQKRPSKNSFFEYKFLTEFQSHEAEFDCLKSLEIEERINMIKWAKRQNQALYLLACNDKTIKLWKVHHRKVHSQTPNSNNRVQAAANPLDFKFSSLMQPNAPKQIAASRKRVYSNAHQYHINSISINCDGATFISADDLRINLWDFECSSESFNILDIKPANLEELTDVITCSVFHPAHCNLFAYGSSSSSVKLVDLRDSALCDHPSRQFMVEEDPADKTFFSEILNSISDVQFSRDGRFVITRDFLTLKIWDMNMEREPVVTIPVHDYMRNHLIDLYENDCMFDRFELSVSHDGCQILTGSYNNNFAIHNSLTKSTISIEALKDGPKRSKGGKPVASPPPHNVNMMDFGKKALHCAWHPHMNVVAVAGLNKLYIYQGKISKTHGAASAAPSPASMPKLGGPTPVSRTPPPRAIPAAPGSSLSPPLSPQLKPVRAGVFAGPGGMVGAFQGSAAALMRKPR